MARGRSAKEGPMTPIDYFMGIFVGMCIGLVGFAYAVQ
jgi:hypothetical protein